MDWFEVSKELPPCDGTYWCANHPHGFRDMGSDMGLAFYDGIGFKVQHAYRDLKYWKYIQEKRKRYGKIHEI